MVETSASKCKCIAILCVSLVSFDAITNCVTSQRACIVVSVYFVTDSVRKLLDIPSHTRRHHPETQSKIHIETAIQRIIQLHENIGYLTLKYFLRSNSIKITIGFGIISPFHALLSDKANPLLLDRHEPEYIPLLCYKSNGGVLTSF
jgi:hypothetical protein